MKLGALYRELVQSLKNGHAPEIAESEARQIIAKRAGVRWADIITHPDSVIALDALQAIRADASRRAEGEPLSRIYGEREFYGRTFTIGPATLDPRPDTETLIETVLQTFHVKQNPQKTAENCPQSSPETPLRILDLGTGSGCIALTLLLEIPGSVAYGVDLSEETLGIFLQNAARHGLYNPQTGAGRAQAVCGNWAEALRGDFDLVVSNPPYIAESVIPNLDLSVRNHDPILALDGGLDGLQAYREIFKDLPRLLKPGGRAYFEIGYDQGDSVMRLAEESRIRVESIHRDLGGQHRVVAMTRGDK